MLCRVRKFGAAAAAVAWGVILGLVGWESNAQVPQFWSPRGVGGGGALFGPSISPHDTRDLYVGCDMTECFHSRDGGLTWAAVPFRQLQIGGFDQGVQFTADPERLYALDHQPVANLDVVRPVRSLDGGATWEPLSSDPTGSEAFSLIADPTSTDRLLVASYTTVYLSANGGTSFQALHSRGAGLHFAGAFFDGNRIYLGTQDGLRIYQDDGSGYGLVRAVDVPSGRDIVSLTGAKTAGAVRLFCVTMAEGDVYPGVRGSDAASGATVHRYDEAPAAIWQASGTGIPTTAYPFFASMARSNIETAYVAGGSASSAPIVYKTTDGGGTWTSVLLTSGNGNVATAWQGQGGDRGWSYGEYALGFEVAPSDPDTAVFTDLGFAHITTDGGATWRQAYAHAADQHPPGQNTPAGAPYHSIGIENTSSWWLHWSSPQNIFAGYSDIRGIRSVDAGLTWSFDYTGHTLNSMYQIVEHPASGMLYAAVASVHDLFQSTYLTDARIDGATGAVLMSADHGATWTTHENFGRATVSIALDPTNPERAYAAVVHSTQGGIYTTANLSQGTSAVWTLLPAPPRTEGHPCQVRVLDDGAVVCSFSGRRTTNFTASSGVFLSTNQGQTWSDRSAPGMHYWTKDVVIDPHDPLENTWYAAVFSGWGGPANDLGGLYRTADRGQNWTRIFTNFRVESCTIDPSDRNVAYVTTEIDGLWVTENLPSTAPAFQPVATYPFRHPTRVFFNPHEPGEIWVTSFGNGLRVGRKVEPKPRLAVMDWHAVQGPLLRLEGAPGQRCLIQTSTDLAAWEDWTATLLLEAGELDLAHPAAAADPARFYRAVLLNP